MAVMVPSRRLIDREIISRPSEVTGEHKNKSLIERLGFAWAGLVQCLRQEASFRFQLIAAVLVIAALVALQPPLIWIAIVILISALILSAELFNSALERLADELDSASNPGIKAAKDMAAAAVLVLACTAIVMGVFVLYMILAGAGL